MAALGKKSSGPTSFSSPADFSSSPVPTALRVETCTLEEGYVSGEKFAFSEVDTLCRNEKCPLLSLPMLLDFMETSC